MVTNSIVKSKQTESLLLCDLVGMATHPAIYSQKSNYIKIFQVSVTLEFSVSSLVKTYEY